MQVLSCVGISTEPMSFTRSPRLATVVDQDLVTTAEVNSSPTTTMHETFLPNFWYVGLPSTLYFGRSLLDFGAVYAANMMTSKNCESVEQLAS